MIRALLELIPSDAVHGALEVYDHWAPIVEENQKALEAARAALAAGHSPIIAVRAFAARTTTPLDDAAVDALEAAIRRGLLALDAACAAGALLAASEPAIRTALDATMASAFGVAYQVAAWRHTIRAWAQDDVPPTLTPS